MKISTLSKETKISIHTIRYYEKLGLIRPKKNDYYKEYTQDIQESLFEIRALKEIGFTLKEILEFQKLNQKDIQELSLEEQIYLKELLKQNLTQIDKKISKLKNTKTVVQHMILKMESINETR